MGDREEERKRRGNLAALPTVLCTRNAFCILHVHVIHTLDRSRPHRGGIIPAPLIKIQRKAQALAVGGEESDFSCVSRHRAHPLKHGHPDDPGGGDEEVPERAHVAGIASEVLGEARWMVSITTPRAADSHHFLYGRGGGNRGPERRGRREGGKRE